MKKWLIILVASGFAALASGANAASMHHPSRHAAVQREQRVACTVLGCQPIPAACTPTEEHSFNGPTGYDTIICPPGVWPF